MLHLWNKTKTRSAASAMIKVISINPDKVVSGKEFAPYIVKGEYTNGAFFLFGEFDDLGEAQEFVEDLHRHSL